MSVYKRSAKNKLSYAFLGGVAVFGIALVVFLNQLSGHIREICEYKGREAATEIMNKAVSQQLDSEKDNVYIKLSRDSDGKITSIESNTAAVNKVNNDIASALNNSLSKIENEEIGVPIGTLSGLTILNGRGSDVTIKLHQIGAVKTKMKSEFSSAGINQTKYRLYVEATVELTAILPGHSTDITINYEYLAGETVIVGDVPQMYLSK